MKWQRIKTVWAQAMVPAVECLAVQHQSVVVWQPLVLVLAPGLATVMVRERTGAVEIELVSSWIRLSIGERGATRTD